MADEPAGKPADTPAATADTPPDVPEGAENPDAVKRALEAERSAAKEARKRAEAAEAKLAEREEADKSELEKAQGKLSKAEERAASAEAKLLRFEVAKEKQIPADAVDLLNGSSREDLEASADKILSLVEKGPGAEPAPDFNGGPRDTPPEPKTPEQQINEISLGLLGVPTSQ